jgi:hypothetical protein
MTDTIKPPIKSGWRGDINGHIEDTESHISVSEITLKLDAKTAYALCNQLSDGAIERAHAVEGDQVEALSTLGAALGRMIDHYSANNGGRKVTK